MTKRWSLGPVLENESLLANPRMTASCPSSVGVENFPATVSPLDSSSVECRVRRHTRFWLEGSRVMPLMVSPVRGLSDTS